MEPVVPRTEDVPAPAGATTGIAAVRLGFVVQALRIAAPDGKFSLSGSLLFHLTLEYYV